MEEEAAQIEQVREEIRAAVEQESTKGERGNEDLVHINPDELPDKYLELWDREQSGELTREELESFRREEAPDPKTSEGHLLANVANKLGAKVMQESLKAEEAA